MYYEQGKDKIGVLNDFDLAAIMDVGDRSPKKQGFERTGTLPYMAIELLDSPDGKLPRWFRHDLESCMWCLVCQSLEKLGKRWYSHDVSDVLFVYNLGRQRAHCSCGRCLSSLSTIAQKHHPLVRANYSFQARPRWKSNFRCYPAGQSYSTFLESHWWCSASPNSTVHPSRVAPSNVRYNVSVEIYYVRF